MYKVGDWLFYCGPNGQLKTYGAGRVLLISDRSLFYKYLVWFRSHLPTKYVEFYARRDEMSPTIPTEDDIVAWTTYRLEG